MLWLCSAFKIIPNLCVSQEHKTEVCYSQGDYHQKNQTRGEEDISFQWNMDAIFNSEL